METKVAETLNLEVSSRDGVIFLTANGRITIDSSPALRDKLLAILDRHVPVLTVDLSAVPYIDASGMATLVEALKFARARETQLRLLLDERPRYLMEVSGLLPLFDATPNTSIRPSSED